ncbi:MAG: AEC family transporter [Pseudorhodoplanes sp.]
MQAIATITVPFFAIIFFGYVAARLRWVPQEAVPAFNGFLLYFAVPALLFRLVSEMPVVEVAQSGYLMAYSVAGVLTLVFIVAGALGIFNARLRDAAFYGLAGSVTNVGYLGIPLVVALLGERAAGPAIMSTVVDQTVTAAVALALAQFDISGRRGWIRGTGEAMLRALTNPFLMSIAAGAAVSLLGWKVPTPAVEIVRLLANSAGPCALFAIGVSLVRINAPFSSAIIALPVSGKLLLHPILAWLILSAFNIDPFAKTVAVLTAALPTAGWAFIFAQRYDADAPRVSAVILCTTALSFVTVSGLVWWLQIKV